MLVCDAPEFERWTPDFSSSGQPSPDWTRVVSGDTQLVNGLEAVEWDENPVQVAVCETCGYTDCAFGGYVHVSRAGSYVVWSEPRPPGEEPEYEEHQYAAAAAIVRHGAVVVPAAVWARWPGVPAIETLPPTRRGDLVGAWHASAPPREHALATERGELEDAFAAVDAVERWFDADPDAPVGELVPVGDGAVTIFYDGPRLTEWTPAVPVGDDFLPVFAGGLTPAGATR